MKPDTNITEEERDVAPITDTTVQHPVGIAVGATSGAMAGAAAGMAGGPLGVAAGALVGALAGGSLGHSTAATISPTEEDLYWQENHPSQLYAHEDEDFTYDDYRSAYQVGWEGPARYGSSFESASGALRTDWEERRGPSRLQWEKAEPAARAAWDRASERSRIESQPE